MNDKVINQSVYIHNNVVNAGMERCPEDYIYSSAINSSDKKELIEVKFIE